MDERCPVCGSKKRSLFARATDTEYRTDERLYEYVYCEECGSVFLVDPPKNELSKIYPANYYSFADTETPPFLERVKAALERRLFRGILNGIPGATLRILDVGGGTGWLLTQVRQSSRRIRETHIVDINAEARLTAEKAGHVYHLSTIEAFTSDLRFDCILMLNLLEHVADPIRVLRKLMTLLAPRGVLLVKTPNIDTLDARLFRKKYWGGLHCPRHFVLFTRDSLIAAAERCGLRCERAWYTQGAPQWTCSVLGSLAAKNIISVSRERPMYRHPLYAPLLALFACVDFLRRPFSKTAQMMAVFRRIA